MNVGVTINDNNINPNNNALVTRFNDCMSELLIARIMLLVYRIN